MNFIINHLGRFTSRACFLSRRYPHWLELSLKASPRFSVDWHRRHWARRIPDTQTFSTASSEHRLSLLVKNSNDWYCSGIITSLGWSLYSFHFSILKHSIILADISILFWAPASSGDAQATQTLSTLSFIGSGHAVVPYFQYPPSNTRSSETFCSVKRLKKIEDMTNLTDWSCTNKNSFRNLIVLSF